MWIRYLIAYLILIVSIGLCGTYLLFLWLLHSWIVVLAQVCLITVCVLGIAASILLLLWLARLVFGKRTHDIGEYGSVVQGFFSVREVRPLQPKVKHIAEQRQARVFTELSGIFPPPGEFTDQERLYRREAFSRSSENESGNERASLPDYQRGLLPQEGGFQGSGNEKEAILKAYEESMVLHGKAVKSTIAKELGMTGRKYVQFCQQWKELDLS